MSNTEVLTIPTARRKSGLIFFIAVIGLFALLLVLGWTMMQKNAPPLGSGNAPEFELVTFEGQTISLAGLHGKPVVLNFWASWCLPCRDEAPYLQASWDQYKSQGLMLIGVDYVDTEAEAKKYMAAFKITYPTGPDVGTKISKSYRITGVPETYFITRDGKILEGVDANGRPYGNWIGPIPPAALQERILRLLSLNQ
jgi:cytochrome c biogenesis protein CcmG, thiol:disulfide interchange protein DsbE